jgi:hypothetical protein
MGTLLNRRSKVLPRGKKDKCFTKPDSAGEELLEQLAVL